MEPKLGLALALALGPESGVDRDGEDSLLGSSSGARVATGPTCPIKDSSTGLLEDPLEDSLGDPLCDSRDSLGDPTTSRRGVPVESMEAVPNDEAEPLKSAAAAPGNCSTLPVPSDLFLDIRSTAIADWSGAKEPLESIWARGQGGQGGA